MRGANEPYHISYFLFLIFFTGKGVGDFTFRLLFSEYNFSLGVEIAKLALFSRPIQHTHRHDKEENSQNDQRQYVSIAIDIHTMNYSAASASWADSV